jgi:hypothetical protein
MRYISDKAVKKIKTHILFSTSFCRKLCRLTDSVEKYGTAREVADKNIGHILCKLDN